MTPHGFDWLAPGRILTAARRRHRHDPIILSFELVCLLCTIAAVSGVWAGIALAVIFG